MSLYNEGCTKCSLDEMHSQGWIKCGLEWSEHASLMCGRVPVKEVDVCVDGVRVCINSYWT